MLRDRLNTVLRTAALLCLTAITAQAEENLGWHSQKGEHGASLFYGIPQTDHAPLSFSCTQDSDDLAFVFAFAPINAVEGVEIEVLLEAGNSKASIATTGARVELDDSFILEGRTVLDFRLVNVLTSAGSLSVFVEDGAEEYPLDGAREAVTTLIESCAGKPAEVQPTETTQCNLAAWVMEGAPADLPVRSGPGPDYPVVATIPRPYTDGEQIYFPEVTITGSRDGWFRISEIITDLYGGWPTDPITTFSGEGWLPGNVLRLWVQSGRLWSRPSDDAPIASIFNSYDFKVDTLHACTGERHFAARCRLADHRDQGVVDATQPFCAIVGQIIRFGRFDDHQRRQRDGHMTSIGGGQQGRIGLRAAQSVHVAAGKAKLALDVLNMRIWFHVSPRLLWGRHGPDP